MVFIFVDYGNSIYSRLCRNHSISCFRWFSSVMAFFIPSIICYTILFVGFLFYYSVDTSCSINSIFSEYFIVLIITVKFLLFSCNVIIVLSSLKYFKASISFYCGLDLVVLRLLVCYNIFVWLFIFYSPPIRTRNFFLLLMETSFGLFVSTRLGIQLIIK